MIDSLTFFNFAKFSSPLVLYLVLMVIVRIALDKIPLFKLTLSSTCRRDGKKYFTYAHHMYLFNCYIGNVWNRCSRSFSRIGLLSLAIGLIFKDLGSSIITSISFIFYKPFAVGDKIRIEGIEGEVVKIDMRYTILDSEEELHMIPNSSLSNTKITLIKKDFKSKIHEQRLS